MSEKPYSVKTLAQVAADLGLKVSSLRTEIRRGTLRPIVIAGRFYLTPDLVGEMLEACRAKPKGQGSISDDCEQAETGGSSSTANPSVALDAANMTLQELKKHSRATSPASTSRRGEQRIALSRS